ncbi:MAG: PAS domain-containing protein [Euryarchaeota archaeon]|nr:PAS domain-containing protein [Euryarchaeota archaeon]MBU4608023.1 PAS domain-containing protein [Euryarchaeota archaeon]MBV1728666.1 PAS domain-containing protein [Methanobacterium sp.]MBV1754748.1 PAS domain-containing protein [Methanobacterium sp.]MBV1766919.1 PAS domain-containing protein [Methanobacterium sp.]
MHYWDLIAIIDSNHRIVKVNKAMANCLDISPHHAKGLHCYEMVHHTSEPINSCPHSKMLKSGVETTEEIQEDNLGGYFLVTVAPIQDFNGEIIGSVHIARDISNRRKIEQ